MTPRTSLRRAPHRPDGRPAIRFRWRSLLFLHWRLPAETLRPLIPAGLEIDLFDDSAWIALVPFTMDRIRHRWMPPIPTFSAFHECNVRTYVIRDGEPGVWFFSLDAASRLAVWGARTLWHLNYKYAHIMLDDNGNHVRYAVSRRHAPRATMRAAWTVGAPRPIAREGTLEHFLTERYQMYAADPRGRLFRGRILHDPWPLHEAMLHELDDGLIAAAGVTLPAARFEAPDSILASPSIMVDAWPLERADHS